MSPRAFFYCPSCGEDGDPRECTACNEIGCDFCIVRVNGEVCDECWKVGIR